MKPVIRILAIIVSLSLVVSCGKSHNDADADNLRISGIEMHGSGGGNGSLIIDFVYDDQQRVDQLVYSSPVDPNSPMLPIPPQVYQCYYNGTDKVPSKATGRPPGDYIEAAMFYRYNNAGQLIWDSTQSTSSTDRVIREYSYLPGSILVKKGTYSDISGGVAGNQVTDSFVIRDNNLTEAYFRNISMAYQYSGVKCTYDNKINPINKLNLAAWMPIDGIPGFPSFLAPGTSKNNIVAYIRGYTSNQGEFIIQDSNHLEYTYNNNGLPEKCVMKASRGNTTVKYYYEAIP